jgi:FAD/FMN-containing dehydrogenase
VLASGEVIVASNEAEPDLFWAIRGGGGNFGVVTWFEYQAYSLKNVLGGPVLYPVENARAVFRNFLDLTQEVPDDLTTAFAFLHAPDGSGTKLCGPAVCHAGEDTGVAESDVRAFREFGTPAADMVDRIPYPVMNTLLDGAFPPGTLNYWKAAYVTELSDATADVIVKAFEAAPTEMCTIIVELFHGAVTRVEPTATAFPHRERGYDILIMPQWTDPADTDICISWARETFHALQPYMAERVYVNYLSHDEEERVRQAYGPNYDRLVELKRRYDPGNVFRLNQNIKPGG